MAKHEDFPDWLREVIESACTAFEVGMPGHIGWSVLFGGDGWEAWIYPTRIEIVGGKDDGEECLPDHRAVNVSGIAALFDEPPDVDWRHSADDITEVSIDGKVKGHELWLHIQEEPPDGVGATVRFDVNTGAYEEKEPRDEPESFA